MMLIEVVALFLVWVIALFGGGLIMHVLVQRKTHMQMARVAHAEARNLDEELRRFNGEY